MIEVGWWKFHRKIENSETWKRLNPFGRDVLIAILNNVDFESGVWITSVPKIKNHVHQSTGEQNIKTALRIMRETNFISEELIQLTDVKQRKITVINWLIYQHKITTNRCQPVETEKLTDGLTGGLTGGNEKNSGVNTEINNKLELPLTDELTGGLTGGNEKTNRQEVFKRITTKEVKNKDLKDFLVDDSKDEPPTETVIPALPKKAINKKLKPLFSFEPIDLELAELLKSLIIENKPDRKITGSINSWANEIRLMRTRDNRNIIKIREIITWSQKDSFWWKNILSGSKLREQYDKLETDMNDKSKSNGFTRFPTKEEIRQQKSMEAVNNYKLRKEQNNHVESTGQEDRGNVGADWTDV